MLRTMAVVVAFVVAAEASAQCVAPSVSSEPAGTTIAAGRSATLTTVVAGTEPLDYDWYETTGGAAQLRSETGPSITVSPLRTTTYFARISNACGSTVTSAAEVAVNGPPVIVTEPPASTTKCFVGGETASFSVSVVGPGPMTYTWYGRRSDGQFAVLKTTPSAGLSDGFGISFFPGSYGGDDYIHWVVISNSYGSTVSRPWVARNTPTPGHVPRAVPSPVRPGDWTMLTGDTRDVDSNCCSWNEEIVFLNYRHLGTTRRLFFQPANSMTIQSIAGDGCYMVAFSRKPTFVTVSPTAPPPAPCTQPVTITAEPPDAGAGAGNPLSVSPYAMTSLTATGSEPILYDWYKVGPNGESILQPPTSNTLRVWSAYGTGTYFAWVYNSCGAQATRAVTIRDCVAPPEILIEPADVTITAGQSTSVFLQAIRGRQNIQWYRVTPAGSVPVGTSHTLVVAPTQTETYFAWVYNDCGATATRAVTVTVQ